MARVDSLPDEWDERSALVQLLAYVRTTAIDKCTGVSDVLAAAAPLPGSPLMSLGGVLNHLRWVDHSWLDTVLVGGPDRGPWTEEEPDREFTLGAELPLSQVISDYEEQTVRLDTLVAEHDLDEVCVRPTRDRRTPTLRWVLLHLIKETARHNGHLDILREMADGSRGPLSSGANLVPSADGTQRCSGGRRGPRASLRRAEAGVGRGAPNRP